MVQPEGTYWDFLPTNGRLRYLDKKKVAAGSVFCIEEDPILFRKGYHASIRAIDALKYSRGATVSLVTLGGIVLHDQDTKIPEISVAQERTVLWLYSAGHLLREFACDVAEESLLAERSVGREPDPRCFTAVGLMREFMASNVRKTEWGSEWNAVRELANEVAWNAEENMEWDDLKYPWKRDLWRASEIAGKSGISDTARSAAVYATEFSPWVAAKWVAYSAEGSASWVAATKSPENAPASAGWYEAGDATRTALNEVLTDALLAAMAREEGKFAPSVRKG